MYHDLRFIELFVRRKWDKLDKCNTNYRHLLAHVFINRDKLQGCNWVRGRSHTMLYNVERKAESLLYNAIQFCFKSAISFNQARRSLTLISKFPGHELDRITGKLIQIWISVPVTRFSS